MKKPKNARRWLTVRGDRHYWNGERYGCNLDPNVPTESYDGKEICCKACFALYRKEHGYLEEEGSEKPSVVEEVQKLVEERDAALQRIRELEEALQKATPPQEITWSELWSQVEPCSAGLKVPGFNKVATCILLALRDRFQANFKEAVRRGGVEAFVQQMFEDFSALRSFLQEYHFRIAPVLNRYIEEHRILKG